MKKSDILEALTPVTNAFEELSIPYFIGGSIASSIYGIARATMDVDIVAKIQDQHITSLKELLHEQYYIDEDMISEAIRMKSSFNLLHLDTMIKIDVFVFREESYQKMVLQRKRKDSLGEEQEGGEFYFTSAEDIILNKLQWYKTGGKVSEQQWLDIIGVLKVQKASLDKEYLTKWAKQLDLMILLEEAFKNAGF